MAERYDFYVHDNRKITFNLTEPIMREDSGVTDFVFHIPKILNELEVSDWAWWLVFVNANKEKYSIALTLSDDPESPLERNIATYTVDYAMSIKAGSVQFALEAINTGTGGAIDNEWHTLTYETKVKETLQGNQAEYAETESDIISALLEEVRTKMNQVIGGATPTPVPAVSQMTDTSKLYLLTTDGEWYYYNGSAWVSGGVYGAGVVDSAPTQGSTNAVSSGGVYSALDDKADKDSTPESASTVEDDADLYVCDDEGNVLAEFEDGHFRTKNFDTKKVLRTTPTDASSGAFDLIDTQGNVVLRIVSGEVQTKHFDSAEANAKIQNAETDIEALKETVGSEYIVPDYWKSYLESKEATINAHNISITTGESFIFFTDYHVNTNNENSMPLMRHIADHTSITDVIYGGDTTDGGRLPTPESAEAVLRKFANTFKPLRIKPIRGNHDCEPSAYQTINKIPDAAFYDSLLRPIESDIVTAHPNSIYYHWDNENQKIRHIVTDSGGMENPLDTTQITWLQSKLLELESSWTAIIHQHIVMESTPAEQTAHLVARGTALLNAIGDVFEDLKCTIAGIVCGHLHVDYIMETDYNFSIIGTTCDAGGANSDGYDWNNPTRPAGTTNEQAFDVYSIDTTSKTMYITRIGAGSDRVVSY